MDAYYKIYVCLLLLTRSRLISGHNTGPTVTPVVMNLIRPQACKQHFVRLHVHIIAELIARNKHDKPQDRRWNKRITFFPEHYVRMAHEIRQPPACLALLILI